MSVSKASSPSVDDSSPVVLDLGDYLAAIGLGSYAPAEGASACEVCGSPEADILREAVGVTVAVRVRFAVVCCRSCGFLYQTPRFAKAFYRDYYERVYRLLIAGDSRPTEAYVADQIARGSALAESLGAVLPPPGRLLDVGCAAGGLMKPFLDRGWSGLGIDPDRGAVAYGAEVQDCPSSSRRRRI